MNRYDAKDYVGEQYITAEMFADSGYVKHVVRAWKHEALDRLLDEAWHGRYWVIRFDEEWLDARFAHQPGLYYSIPREGDKIVRLRMRITEAHTERWVIPEPPLPMEEVWEYSTRRYAKTVGQRIKKRLYDLLHN
jgi:hypothetical protein